MAEISIRAHPRNPWPKIRIRFTPEIARPTPAAPRVAPATCQKFGSGTAPPTDSPHRATATETPRALQPRSPPVHPPHAAPQSRRRSAGENLSPHAHPTPARTPANQNPPSTIRSPAKNVAPPDPATAQTSTDLRGRSTGVTAQSDCTARTRRRRAAPDRQRKIQVMAP